MQVARLLHPHTKTIAGKAQQMARALQLEWQFSKSEILHMYAMLAPYGGNIEGVRAASLFWFGKAPARLTAAEAALLVALPQNPTYLRPDAAPDKARQARNRVLDIMVARGVISAADAVAAKQDPMPVRRYATPFFAPHLAEIMVQNAGAAQAQIRTTLDKGVQHLLEIRLRRAKSSWPAGVTAAALVADHRTGQVVAYVGSADYFDPVAHGAVDMVRAIRSPGSTLKPFVYGMAFAKGLVHPQTLIRDEPAQFGAYAPTNFSGGYFGDVTIAQALQASLNVPAVKVLDRLGVSPFIQGLQGVGLTIKVPEGQDFGLPIVLGGGGVSLWQLVQGYGVFTGADKAYAITAQPRDKAGAEAALLPSGGMSRQARVWVRDILRKSPAAYGYVHRASLGAGDQVAYKTGTSYGFRDAWAIGVNSRYTVGIWVGRPDGQPVPGFYGRKAAAPLLFDVFEFLPQAPAFPPVAAETQQRPDALPQRLSRFAAVNSMQPGGGDHLRLQFPEDGDIVVTPAGAAQPAPLQVRVHGGRPPFVWFWDEQPLQNKGATVMAAYVQDTHSQWRHTITIQPRYFGHHSLSVQDASGAWQRVHIRLLPVDAVN
jgi:penicillin-binding protein 1C